MGGGRPSFVDIWLMNSFVLCSRGGGDRLPRLNNSAVVASSVLRTLFIFVSRLAYFSDICVTRSAVFVT